MRLEVTRAVLAACALAAPSAGFRVAVPLPRHAISSRRAATTPASASSPSAARWPLAAQRRPQAQQSLSMGIADALPGPLKGLFGSGKSGGRRSSTSTRSEGAALYRSMGVPEDATYEEVLEAFERLKLKYKGDRKSIVKLEKTKDDIMDLRLRQRMAGTLKVSSQARDVDSAMDAMERRRKKFVMPKWTQGWIVLPKDGHAMRMLYYFGMLAGAAVVFPSMCMSANVLGALLCVGTMTSRGAPPARKDEMGQIMEYKMPGKFSMLSAFAIAVLAGMAGGAVGALIGSKVGETLILADSWVSLGQVGIFLLLSTFVSTYREGRSKGRGVF